MSEVFVVRNQHGQYANKHKEWVDGREPKLLFRSLHHDEAVNLVFELSSKDIYVRAAAVGVELGENKQPIVEVTAPPPDLQQTHKCADTPPTDTDETNIDSQPAELQ